MIDLVKQPAILQKWNTLTIRERCEEIQRDLNIRINYRLLYDIYKGLGIKLRRPQQVYVRSRSELVELKDKRFIFATSLQAAIDSNQDVIYMDETTVSNNYPKQISKFHIEGTFPSLRVLILKFQSGKHAYASQ